MSSGAKQRLYIGAETTVNTPATAFNVLKFTDTSVDATVNKTESTSIADTRLAQGSFITSVDYAGDINVEAQKSTVLENLMAAAAFTEWDDDVLSFGGTTRKTFTVIRGFSDVDDYHRFTGCHVNTFTLTIPEDGVITYGFGLMGMGRSNSTTPPVSPTPSENKPIMSSVSVGNILINGMSQAGISCITAVSMEVNNNMQVQRCLGGGVNPGAILETVAGITGSFTAAWSRNTSNTYEKQFTNAVIALEVPFEDTAGNKYVLNIPEAEITATLPSGGNSDILSADFSYTAVRTPVTITRVTA